MPFILFLFSLSTAWASGFGEYFPLEKRAWDSANHPAILVKNPVVQFSALPLNGRLSGENLPWSDDFRPRKLGGISYRWQDISGETSYRIISERKARQLTADEVRKLSPAEKFDLLLGAYDFPFTRRVKNQNPSHRPIWEGLCDGRAQASIHHPQFTPKTLVNPDGVEIAFGSSDLAALMSYYYAKVSARKVRFLGRRCRSSSGSTSIKCTDMNAGAFHVVIANLIGMEKKSFIIDRDPGREVWNHPVSSYQSKIREERSPSQGSAPGTAKEVLVSTQIDYLHETGSSWNPPPRVFKNHTLWYWLELDGERRIIGGSWTDTSHPDFAWTSEPARIREPYSFLLQN